MHKIAEKYKLTNNEILRMDNNFLINMLVCFKHISLSSGMNKKNKLSEIKKISILPDRQKLYSQQMINYDTQIR